MGIRWTEEEAIEYGFTKDKNGNWQPNVRERTKSSSNSSGALPQPEPSVCNETKKSNESKKTRKKSSSKSPQGTSSSGYPKFRIYVKSYRKRHLDPDNLCPKWYIDEIVKAGYLPDDSSKYVEFIEKSVEVILTEEHTVITVTRVV